MILADTSVWVQHFRYGDPLFSRLLLGCEILTHPFIVGELALGSLADRETTVRDLGALPQAIVAQPEEVLTLIEQRCLFGSGLGYVDAHLLAAALLDERACLWTFDKRLAAAAGKLGVMFTAI